MAIEGIMLLIQHTETFAGIWGGLKGLFTGEGFVKGFKDAVAEFRAGKALADTIPGATAPGTATPGAEGATGKAGKLGTSISSVESRKATNINITIGKLIEKQEITANNIKETTQKMSDEVKKALLSMLNDVNLIAT